MVRHRIDKNRLQGGKSSNVQLMRNLARSFIHKGTLTSTAKRVRVIRTEIEILIGKAKKNSQADRDFVSNSLADKETSNILIQQVAPVFHDVVGGYVRIIRLTPRQHDAAVRARLEWTRTVVLKPIEVKKTKLQKEAEGKKKPRVAKKTKGKKQKKTK